MPTAKTFAFPRMWVNSTAAHHPVWRRAIGEELGRASQRLDDAYRRIVAAGGVPAKT
jgi:hypothetical protein